jgi:type III secretory pathway component EscT
MKKLIWIAIALVLLVLFPGLAQGLAAAISATVLFLAAQPILIGVVLGLIAAPHLRRAKTSIPAGH